MLSKLNEENTWSCSICKNINKIERTLCTVCCTIRSSDPDDEYKGTSGTQRAEITYDELKKQNEENADNEELIQSYKHKAQEQKRKMEMVKETQKESEIEYQKYEDERMRGGYRGSRGGGRGGGNGRGGFGNNMRGRPTRGGGARGGRVSSRGGGGRGGRGMTGRYDGSVT